MKEYSDKKEQLLGVAVGRSAQRTAAAGEFAECFNSCTSICLLDHEQGANVRRWNARTDGSHRAVNDSPNMSPNFL